MKVSVVVPVYNAAKFLDRAVGSALGQTHKDIQLILVDDGSADNSLALCGNYAGADGRVLVLSRKNGGPAAARNAGMRAATGELLFFLDADDYLEPRALERLVSEYERSRPDMVLSGFSKLENSGRLVTQPVTFRLGEVPEPGPSRELSPADIVGYVRHFLRHPSNHLISYCWARLYKLSVIRENDIYASEDMRLFEDLVFNLDYLKHAKRTVFVSEPLYVYAMHNEHVSASMGIVNAESLLHDMAAFKDRVSGFLREAGAGTISGPEIDGETGHALAHYAIIFLIRSCRNVTAENRARVSSEIKKLLAAPLLKDSLASYSPQKGNSRLLPLLMKRGLVRPLMSYCGYRARRRYGRLKL